MSTGRRDTPVRGRTPKVAGRRVAGRPSTSRPRTDPGVAPGVGPTREDTPEVDETPDAAGVAETTETTETTETAEGGHAPFLLDPPDADEAPEAEAGDLDGDDPEDPDRYDGEPGPGFSTRLSLVLLAAALVVAAAGMFLWLRADAQGEGGSNTAVVDAGATVEVTTAVREGLERIFSYRFDATALTEEAAKQVLTGDAAGQYETLFKQVREQAPAQQLVLRSKVVRSGVSALEGDRATLLVFLDQTATRGDTGSANTGGAQLSVSAQRVDGVWRISALVPR